MTLNSPLAVHLAGMGFEKHVDINDLEFTRDARGGPVSATFTLPEWVDSSDPVFGPVSRVMIDDGRNGRRVFEGFLDLPGKTVDESGHTWKIGAVGAASVLGDSAAPYIAIDTDLTGFEVLKATSAGATGDVTTLPNAETVPALVMQFPSGQPVDSSSYISMQYKRLVTSVQVLGGFGYTRVSGRTDTGYQLQAVIKTPSGVKTTVRAANFSTTPSTPTPDEVGASWTPSQDRLSILIARTGGATNITTDNVWAAVYNVWLRAQFTDINGTPINAAGAHSNAYVYAHQVVIDALWKLSNQINIPHSLIDTTFSQQIPQLAYPDPVRLTDLLSDLALIEPDMVWEVGPSNTDNLHSFTLRRWPTDVRYEATTVDGWDSPGGEYDLSTDVSISWVDQLGQPQTYAATFPVPALDQWNRRRDMEIIDLGSEIGSLANASDIAAALQVEMAAVPYAGTLTVGRPIRDLYTGREVYPWEIQPGYLVNVRDIDAPAMRLTEMTYHDADQSASLTLGTPVFSLDELLAKLARRRTRKAGKPKALTPK